MSHCYTLQVQQMSVRDAGPVVPEDNDPPGENAWVACWV